MAVQPIYQFVMELNDYKPKIWRRIQVLGDVNIAKLGYIVMSLFEMEGRHSFNFEVPVIDNLNITSGGKAEDVQNKEVYDMLEKNGGKVTIELFFDDYKYEPKMFTINALEITLNRVLSSVGERMYFNYDYSDRWQITLQLEKIFTDSNLPESELPILLDGEGFGIIEDCGGVDGLAEIATAFKDKGEGYAEYCEWLDLTELDIEAFNKERVDFKLKKFPKLFKESYETEYHESEADDLDGFDELYSPEEAWNKISSDVKRMLLNSTYCPNCTVTTIIDYVVEGAEEGLSLEGKCIKCGQDVTKYVEY